jgi:hypothetical protein
VIVFLALATSPLWLNAASDQPATMPELKLPAEETACVEATETMRATHMQMLNDWRDRVVRQGERAYQATDGKTYEMSLTRTCLGCHTNKAEFCDRCHDYAAVTPYCWDCHVDPKGENVATREEL